MEKYFRTQEGERINIIEHTLSQIEKWPHLKMYIGTDSQDVGKITRNVTVVAYRYGNRGAHFVYLRNEIPKIRDMYTRLYGEGVLTIECAEMISSEIPVAFEALEFDYNTIPRWASNKLISALKGWVQGLGFKGVFKNGDNMMIASKAADHVCRNSDIYK